MSRSSCIVSIAVAADLIAGALLAVALQLAVFPVMGLAVTPAQALVTGGVWTATLLRRPCPLRHLAGCIRREMVS